MTDEEGREIAFEDHVADRRPSAEDRFLDEERVRQMVLALDALPADLRTIVRRKFLENRSHAQIGAEFGVSVPTISRRLSEARSRLRRALDADRDTGRRQSLLSL